MLSKSLRKHLRLFWKAIEYLSDHPLLCGSILGILSTLVFAIVQFFDNTLPKILHIPIAQWTLSIWVTVLSMASLGQLVLFALLYLIKKLRNPFRFYPFRGVDWKYNRSGGIVEKVPYCQIHRRELNMDNLTCGDCDKQVLMLTRGSEYISIYEEVCRRIKAKVGGHYRP